jgi:hypothetical protein
VERSGVRIRTADPADPFSCIEERTLDFPQVGRRICSFPLQLDTSRLLPVARQRELSTVNRV